MKPSKRERLKPLSMYPLSVEDALKAVLATPPRPSRSKPVKDRSKKAKSPAP